MSAFLGKLRPFGVLPPQTTPVSCPLHPCLAYQLSHSPDCEQKQNRVISEDVVFILPHELQNGLYGLVVPVDRPVQHIAACLQGFPVVRRDEVPYAESASGDFVESKAEEWSAVSGLHGELGLTWVDGAKRREDITSALFYSPFYSGLRALLSN